MVGLLDYFQPRRAVGLLGLPIEQQVVGDGLLGSTVLPDAKSHCKVRRHHRKI